MNNIIRLDVANCQNCYKCIRECSLKAIEFKDSRTSIIEKECVLCGTCMEICPRGAKYVRDNISAVKELIKGNTPVCVSVAPSYAGYFKNSSFSQLSKAIKKLGFARVEETAIGAAKVSEEYADLMKENKMGGSIIATACSSVVMLIERHYPELIKNLAPVMSPMAAHAKMMREAYGDIRVCFIGPCLSKMYEADDPLSGGFVDQVITFDDLERWMKEEGIDVEEEESDAYAQGVSVPLARIYPKQEGIIKTINKDDFGDYTPVSVDGVNRCIRFFAELLKDPSRHVFIEANICAGSCIGGPVMRMKSKSVIDSSVEISGNEQPIDKNVADSAKLSLLYPRVFADRSVEMKMPTEDEIETILAKMGKHTKDQELDCGSCGYPTCRAKAIAVFNGKADITMCMPFLRERAENKSSMVIENSPNGIVTFDEDMQVLEINPKAEYLFGVDSGIVGQMIPALYGETAFDDAKEEEKTIVKKCTGATENIIMELSVLYLAKNHMYVAFAKDISEQEQNKEELEKLRLSTVGVAQDVIDKQMRVAQEIASLLGETTAETKVALTKLKNSIQDISRG